MSQQIYTDKDYLDAQFAQINSRFDRHDKKHNEDRSTFMKLAGMVLTAAGIIATFVSAR